LTTSSQRASSTRPVRGGRGADPDEGWRLCKRDEIFFWARIICDITYYAVFIV